MFANKCGVGSVYGLLLSTSWVDDLNTSVKEDGGQGVATKPWIDLCPAMDGNILSDRLISCVLNSIPYKIKLVLK